MHEKKVGYKRNILKHLYFAGSLSCAELSDQIDKSLPLTTKMLNDLLEEGYVVEKGYAPSTGGRRAVRYSLKPDSMYILSVAMDQFVTRIVLMDMHNRYLTGIEKFELPLSKNPEALSQLAEKIEQVIQGAHIPKEKIIGIGIGMPGFVDSIEGINYSFLEIPDSSVTKYIATRLELPVFINNDSTLIALAELKFGVARNRKTAMVINIGWGIGLGLIIKGELYQGENGFAGEFSHIPLFLNGKLCTCGKRGCLETESSLLVVLEKAREGLQAGRQSIVKELSSDHLEQAIETVIAAAGKGDQFMIELLSDAGYTIGRGVAVLIHLLNPEVIILSGRGASPGILWQTPIQQALNEHCIPRLSVNTRIAISNLGYNAEIIGAASLVMENYHQFVKKKLAIKEP
jgi:predicted NBD/HSP70 family sugar kinase